MNANNRKILILHDYFLYKGGGERLIISLAKNLGADVATAFVAKDAFDPRAHGIKTFELFKETIWTKIPGFRYVQVQLAFLFKTKFIKNYDIIIYSGDSLIAMIRAMGWRLLFKKHTPPFLPPLKVEGDNGQHLSSFPPLKGEGHRVGLRHIAYMHTPPRHLYDAYHERLREYVLWKKIIFVPFAAFNRWRFKFLSKRLDLIITNSQNTRARIKQYLGLDSVVVYPPCDTLPFKNLGCGDYFFSWARLYPIKRVDKIVEAFIGLPDKKLIVASGGPELEKIKQMAAGHDNIKVLGWISDEELVEYLGKCLATIYIPIREDFGMSAVESMQASKPVLGVAEGGLLEIIEDSKNGWLLKPEFNLDDLRAAIKPITPELAQNMQNYCQNTAKKFSEQAFIEGIKKHIFIHSA